jgi:hypothetical protein
MFLESNNFAVVQTELDDVFYQTFTYDGGTPGIATATTGALFKQMNIDRAAYIGEINKPVGFWSQVGEIQQVPQGTPQVTNKYTIYIKDYAESMPISKDLFDDNMHQVWSQNVREFARAARLTQDNNAFDLYRKAFTTTLTADGVSWINAAHPLIGGGTQSNLITGALSNTTLNSGMVALRTQKDQAGKVIGGIPKYLVVPPELYMRGVQENESALVADDANNALNVWRSAYGIMIYSTPYLGAAAGGSATAWFLLTEFHSVSRLIRQGVETALTPWQMSTNRTYNYQGNFRESYFVPDYSGAVASTGV